MKLFVFAVKDRATDAFGTPMFMAAPGQAARSFQDEVNRSAVDNVINQHPEDFDLYQFGEWDSETGLFDCSHPKMFLRAQDLVTKE